MEQTCELLFNGHRLISAHASQQDGFDHEVGTALLWLMSWLSFETHPALCCAEVAVDDAAFEKCEALMDRLLELDDVDNVYTNCEGLTQ